MSLPSSGQISLSDINTELGNSSTALITFNDSAVRELANKPILNSSVNLPVDFWDTTTGPQYTISGSPSIITENQSVTFSVTTVDVPNNTTLYWTIFPEVGDINYNDFTSLSLSGNFLIVNGAGSFTISAASDNLQEGPESFSIQLRTGGPTGPIVRVSNTIVVNDQTAFTYLLFNLKDTNTNFIQPLEIKLDEPYTI